MVSRRHVLRLGVGGLAATAGCLGTGSSPLHGSLSGDVGHADTTTPGDVPEWRPEWTHWFTPWDVLGLDVGDGALFATLNGETGHSAVARVDPADQSVDWQTTFEGEAVAQSNASAQHVARGQWGLTLAADAVYAVAGPVQQREWSALHALDRVTGERRWSVRRERRLAVVGLVDDLVVATGLEFFPPPGQTPVSDQTPSSPLSTVVYGLDAADGAVRWTREFDGVRDAAVSTEGVYVAAGDRLVGLDPDGRTRFTYVRGPARRVEAAAGRVYYLTGDPPGAVLHGLAPNGDRDWRRALPVDELLLDGDRLYAGGGAVVAVEPDGAVDWRDADAGRWLLLDPDRDALYTRSGRRADAVTAYDVAGAERWTFDPPSNNAWPEAATADALVVSAITGTTAAEPSLTVYAVAADGRATAAFGRDTVFDAVGLDGTVYLADGDSRLLALVPSVA